MKKLFAIALLASFTTLAAPLQWVCDWPEAKSQTFSLYQGETATFEPTFRVNGHTVTNATIEAVWYQTNGMGNAWWKLDGATFAPSNDVGAAAYRFFVEAKTSDDILYRANGALRMLPSPGFTPNTIELPVARLDFAAVDVLNPPWTDPDYSTSNTALVATIEATAPAPGNYAAVSNAAVYAAITNALQDVAIAGKANRVANATDGNLAALDEYGNPTDSEKSLRDLALADSLAPAFGYDREYEVGDICTSFDNDEHHKGTWLYKCILAPDPLEPNPMPPEINPTHWALATVEDMLELLRREKQDLLPYATNAIPYAAISGKPDLALITDVPPAVSNTVTKAYVEGLGISSEETDPTVPSWAKAETRPTYTASEVGATTAADVYRLVAGTNVVLVVTNYNSATHAAAMKLQHLDPESGQYVTYWDEMRQHGITYAKGTNYTDAAIAERAAPRAWSGTTSGLGSEAPAGVTWISTPETVIAGGFEYEKVVTSAGAVWVLTSNGMSTGATSNSFFRVAASDGTELFSIEKTDSYVIGVNADGITRSGNTVTIPINVVAAEHPYIRCTKNLVNPTWVKEDEGGYYRRVCRDGDNRRAASILLFRVHGRRSGEDQELRKD